MTDPVSLHLDLGNRGYDIIIGDTLLDDAARYIAPLLQRPEVVIVTDDTVAQTWLQPLVRSLDRAGIENRPVPILPVGEGAKNFDQLETLVNDIIGFGIDRTTTILALGGGVVGDLAGFRRINNTARHSLHSGADDPAGPG